MMVVSWDEPLFSDNSHGPVMVTQSHRPPAEFPLGTTHVYYTATDRYHNNATCVIDIVVQGHLPFSTLVVKRGLRDTVLGILYSLPGEGVISQPFRATAPGFLS